MDGVEERQRGYRATNPRMPCCSLEWPWRKPHSSFAGDKEVQGSLQYFRGFIQEFSLPRPIFPAGNRHILPRRGISDMLQGAVKKSCLDPVRLFNRFPFLEKRTDCQGSAPV